MHEFGKRLRELRLDRGLSQRALAELSELSAWHIGKAEGYFRCTLSEHRLGRVIAALSLTEEEESGLREAAKRETSCYRCRALYVQNVNLKQELKQERERLSSIRELCGDGEGTREACENDFVPVPGWDGFSVDQTGRIMGRSGKVLKSMEYDGYLHVMCSRKRKKLRVHRAVLLTFVGPPKQGQEVRHLDGDGKNNRLDNLAWGDRYQQREDDRRNGVSRAHPKLTPELASEIRLLRGSASSRAIGARFGVSHTTILRVWRGEGW